MQGFVIYKYHIDSYSKLPHNTSKKLLRKEQIQLIVVHAKGGSKSRHSLFSPFSAQKSLFPPCYLLHNG
jgi:hypothetical protein